MHDIIESNSIDEPKFETSIIHGEDFVDAARLLWCIELVIMSSWWGVTKQSGASTKRVRGNGGEHFCE